MKSEHNERIQHQILNLTLSALFAALVCVATMLVRIPIPGTQGYIHFGDAFVILTGIFLGPFYGFLAAGIGSSLADLLGGYMFYLPATFLIKGLVAFVAAKVYRGLSSRLPRPSLRCAVCGICSTLLVTAGYFLFEFLFYGEAALASVPSNLIQGISGLVISSLFLPIFLQVPELRKYTI